jgi:starch synthase
VVADGETGLLVPPDEPEALADALNTLARDPQRAEAMGEAGRQRAISEFDWTSIALQTAKLYQEVAGSSVKQADT